MFIYFFFYGLVVSVDFFVFISDIGFFGMLYGYEGFFRGGC